MGTGETAALHCLKWRPCNACWQGQVQPARILFLPENFLLFLVHERGGMDERLPAFAIIGFPNFNLKTQVEEF